MWTEKVAPDVAALGRSASAEFLSVQTVTPGRSPVERDLCFRIEGAGGASGGLDAIDADKLAVKGGTRVCFDRLAPTFFENYWHLLCAFDAVRLTVRYSGSPLLTVWRHTRSTEGDGHRLQVISVKLPADRDRIEVAIDSGATQPFTAGLLSFCLEGDEPFAFLSGAWAINTRPVRDVQLAVVTCTTDYAKRMPALFEGIARDAQAAGWLSRVIVIDQGTEQNIDAAIAARYPAVARRLAVVRQKNAGGSGGFSRGLIEALASEEVTHVAFIDDDSIVVPGSLTRAAAALSVCDPTAILGGQMLDLARPHILLASGQFYEDRTAALTNPALNTDLTGPHWRRAFLDRLTGQWNGWWLAIFPRDAFRDVGFPMPYFLKWDDVEFGVRASQRRYRTITFPGVGVWHDAPDLKPVTWQAYFNVRNALITKALRSETRSALGDARLLLGNFLSYLLTFQYFQARMVIEAMRDFAAGSAILDRPVRAHLRSLNELSRQHPGFSMEPSGQRALSAYAPRTGMLVVRAVCAVIWNLAAPVRRLTRKRTLGSRFADWRSFGGVDVVFVDDPDRQDTYVYRRDPGQGRRLFVSFVGGLCGYLLSSRRFVRDWSVAEPRLTSVEHWQQYLKANDAD